MTNDPRALIYLRVSTDRQAQKGIALPTQKARCLEHAAVLGYQVEPKTDFYEDGGESGRSMDRPALMDLLARCKDDNSVRAVIVYDVSRLARNRLDFAFIKQTLNKAGVALLSATEPINDTPEGQMLEGVLSTVAEFFSAQNARKVRANMLRKAEAGGWPNIAPYGYRNRREKLAEGAIRTWIEPNPEEAYWVVRAFRLFATGRYSVKALARLLNSEGIVVRTRKNRQTRRFHHAHLERMLRNKIYVGMVVWGGVVNENGTHEPLIDPELFYRVQDLLILRSGSTTRTRRYRSLFKGIAFCGECGSAMTIDVKEISSTRSIRYLRCRKTKKDKVVPCRQRYTFEDVYTRELLKYLERLEFSATDAEFLRETLQRLVKEEKHIHQRAQDGLERQIEAVRMRKQNLLLRSLDEDPRDESQRLLYERVRVELSREEERLAASLKRLTLRLDRIVRILEMALEISGCTGRAFVVDEDPEYRGLITRVIFKELRMRDGGIVDGTLSEPLIFLRRWAGEKPLKSLGDLGPLGGPNRVLIDGTTLCQKRKPRASPSRIRDDLLHLQESLTPEQEVNIEACYHELRGRNLLPPSYKDLA